MVKARNEGARGKKVKREERREEGSEGGKRGERKSGSFVMTSLIDPLQAVSV